MTRNESHRYLTMVLKALRPHVDVIHLYDDRSSDDTVELAQDLGAVCSVRLPGLPSFADNEAAFREAGWRDFERVCVPVPADWILAVDADELLVAPQGLGAAIDAAGPVGAVSLAIPEVFAVADGVPMIRVDGYWRGLEAPRLFTYLEGGQFRPPPQVACGAVPSYVNQGVQSREAAGVTLLHLGYLDPDDRAGKFRRYAGLPGHSKAHINSILRPPTLMVWPGGPINVWRGR